MNFQDIFKSKFVESVANVSLPNMILTMVLAFCLGMFIFYVYKKTFSGVMYSSSFGITLVALTMITLIFINRKAYFNPYILVVHCDKKETETNIRTLINSNVNHMSIKSKTVQKDQIEINMEVRLKNDDTDFINTLSEMPGVKSAVLVSYNGDYMG